MFKLALDANPVLRKLAQIQVNIIHLPDALHNALQGKQGQLANEALRKLTIVPGPPVYPIRWKSQKQRRAYFASNGFGRGIPSRRTNTLLKGWSVRYERTDSGGQLMLVNPVPYMRYVQGAEAQPFHLDTGWVQRGDVQDDFVRETTEQITAVWWTVSQAVVEEKKA